MSFQFLNHENSRIIRDTSICLGGCWRLHLQYYNYTQAGGDSHFGYRFINSCDGNLRPQKGQARIPSRKHAALLWAQADLESWADYDEEPVDPVE